MMLAVVLSVVSAAVGQPRIPANELPGREHERFIESPVERFMRPGPHVVPEVVDTAPLRKRRAKRVQRRR
jgi:hypothetical protein